MNLNTEDTIVKYLSGNMSEEERTLFLEEVAKSDVLSSELDSFRNVWSLTNQLSYDQDAVDASWHNFQQEVKAPFRILGFDWLKVAASFTILVAFSLGMWFFGSTDVTFSTDSNIAKLTLADETKIELNSNSVLTYDKSFGNETREVSLSGQAYFNVSKSDKKFIVHSISGDVIVHGTEFSVFANEHTGFTLVELYEGSISYKGKGEDVVLVPGQRLIVDETGEVSISKFVSKSEWSENIACDNVPLSYILGQLNLTYGVAFKVSNRMLKEHYTLSLPKDDLSACIKILNDVSGKSFVLIDNTIVLK
ncbi:MAG: hypothetical protein COA58_02425 [Bacteroidetes bacterium]|nr:MAG: hypothetical protein COA58_02425 [Bacteroidota bacterium]